MQEVTSSLISHVAHDPATNRLTVRFHSGQIYDYDGVPAEEHAALMASDSVGKYFGANIRTKYKGVKQASPAEEVTAS